ncbi:hypothetical protein [Candidatus Pelagibacter sp.]|uniref:hypothetical protein n=1 Tax=Candidatus Pelagibacter sp. TaxID=2024849 RepID=UPI003F85426C
MSKETIEYTENNFDPLNKAIDESIRAQRARIAWQYAKVIALILVSIGILAMLLAWAYNIYKKPNPELVKKINVVDEKFEQSKNIDKQQEKIIDGEIIKYNSETLRFLNASANDFNIVTRITYSTTKDLLEGNSPKEVTCYISKGGTSFEFEKPQENQLIALQNLNLTYAEAKNYQKYCKYNTR